MKKILCALLGLILTLPGFAACPSGQVEQTYTSATGTVTQNGTPTPTNPIEPIFYQQGDMILRKINDTYADSYDATTGKITRRVGVKVFDGTEDWALDKALFYTDIASLGVNHTPGVTSICTHYKSVNNQTSLTGVNYNAVRAGFYNDVYLAYNYLYIKDLNITTVPDLQSFLADQYNAGTPVTVYYPLATETTENWNETTYCANQIKIATTAYNSARFSPVVTELNDTIATIRDVVTNTINQTKAIADLQATKQTRPDETCPAGKKCLLVETEENGVVVPHWYEIIENAD